MELREYQKDFRAQGLEVLKEHGAVYLQGEPRTGKTIVSLTLANDVGSQDVLFLTKKKAIQSILNDYESSGFEYSIDCTNYEQAHKFDGPYDTIIIDEAHNYSTYPKPSNRYKNVIGLTHKARNIIFLSATPNPESFVQLFHQFRLWPGNPWKSYKNFYAWHKDYGIPNQKYFNGMPSNDYSKGIKEKIFADIDKYFVRYTQEKAGFKHTVKEEFVKVKMMDRTYRLIEQLKSQRVIQGKTGAIVADSGGTLNQKCHQMYSGTVKLEDGSAVIIDDSKAIVIHQIEGKKAIYYKFKMEGELLKKVFGDQITEDSQEFQDSNDKIFISQVISGREGVKLDTADVLIMFNIDFAYLSYRQTMDRIQAFDREKEPRLIWLFSENGIEEQIYKVVKNQKENFTYEHFKRMNSKKNIQQTLF